MTETLADRTEHSPDIHTPKADIKGLSIGRSSFEHLQVRVTVTEAVEAGTKAANHRVEAARLKAEAKSMAKDLNDRAKLEEGKAEEHERRSRTHFKTAKVEVREYLDFRRNRVIAVRVDTGRKEGDREMRDDERQASFSVVSPALLESATEELKALADQCVGVLVKAKRKDEEHPGHGAGAIRDVLGKKNYKAAEIHAALAMAVSAGDLAGKKKGGHWLKHPLAFYAERFPVATETPDNVVSINGAPPL